MSARIPENVLLAFLSSHWAMTPEAIRRCYQIITRQVDDIDAVSRELGHPLGNTRATAVRDGIAYIPVRGPMIRYASSFKAISGATSYEALANDVETARRDASVRAIVLDLDSPGGELNGCLELGEIVRQADESKPVYALASGACASAAYLLASATRRITAVQSALVGSLGVCLTIEDDRAKAEQDGIVRIEIVSSQTPNKNEDPLTQGGHAAAQRLVDELAQVYATPIARYRGRDPQTLLQDYGAGALFVGAGALSAGLIDAVAYAEDFHTGLLAELADLSGVRPRGAATTASTAVSQASHQELPMKLTKGQKVRAAAGAGAGITIGAEGTVEEIKDGQAKVLLAGGKSVWIAATKLKAVKSAPAAAAKPAAEEEEEEAEPAAEGEEPEEEEEEEEPAAVADPVKAERTRILGIQALGMAGEESIIQACIDDPTCSVADAALKLRTAQAKKPADRLAARAAADQGMPRAGVPPKPARTVSAGGARVIAAIGRRYGKKPDATKTQA